MLRVFIRRASSPWPPEWLDTPTAKATTKSRFATPTQRRDRMFAVGPCTCLEAALKVIYLRSIPAVSLLAQPLFPALGRGSYGNLSSLSRTRPPNFAFQDRKTSMACQKHNDVRDPAKAYSIADEMVSRGVTRTMPSHEFHSLT